MKIVLKILFVLFLASMIVGFYMKYTQQEKADIVIGLGVLFLSFILMPIFIIHRHRMGKYKKYKIDPNSKNPFKINKDQL